ncbi:hypothetical protein GE061_011306, partial [Apolygus lucorum]
ISFRRMEILAFFLLMNIDWSLAQSTPQPVYHVPVSPVNYRKPEVVNHPKVPTLYRMWSNVDAAAIYQTHLFAGKNEFPYVLWMRAPGQLGCEDDTLIVHGLPIIRRLNAYLLNPNTLVTACKPLAFIYCKNRNRTTWPQWPSKGINFPNPNNLEPIPLWPGSDILDTTYALCPEDDIVIDTCDWTSFDVYYATVKLGEDNKYTNILGEYVRVFGDMFNGDRRVAGITLHPKCQPHLHLEYDVALVDLVAPIFQQEIWITYTPFPVTQHNSIDDRDLDNIQEICYIAGWNEHYQGFSDSDDSQITYEAKVKFRTYQSEMGHCQSFMKIICFDHNLPFLRGCLQYMLLGWDRKGPTARKNTGLECWETRNKVGAVCNYHSGAPLVCSGEVYGHVIRAADDFRCNNQIPCPFVVQRLFPTEIGDFINDKMNKLEFADNDRLPLWGTQKPQMFSEQLMSRSKPFEHRMKILVLLVWNLGWSQGQLTPQPPFVFPPVADDFNKPEPVYHPRVPVSLPGNWHWSDVPEQAKFQAHLFAGKAEFPYVVWVNAIQHISCEDENTFYQKILRRFAGVLLTANTVMTACKPLLHYQCRNTNTSTWPAWPDGKYIIDQVPGVQDFPLFPTGGRSPVDHIITCPEEMVELFICQFSEFTVHYATVYLYEDNRYVDMFGHSVYDFDNRFQGYRQVAYTFVHPKCQPHKTLEYDVGFIDLSAPIPADGTWIGMVNIAMQGNPPQISFDELNDVVKDICYIAAFNEMYAGMPNNDARQVSNGFKVRFRTYKSEMGHCLSYARIICYDNNFPFMVGCWKFLKLEWPTKNGVQQMRTGLECWETRHKVGAVCNIHVGAPLVCNNQVYGHVIRGADDQRCNIMVPLPFIVQRYHQLDVQVFIGIVQQRILDEDPVPMDFNLKLRSRSSRLTENVLLLLLYFFL